MGASAPNLSENQLSGAIPPSLGRCEMLQKLDLTVNFIGDLTGVKSLRVNRNLKILCVDARHHMSSCAVPCPTMLCTTLSTIPPDWRSSCNCAA